MFEDFSKKYQQAAPTESLDAFGKKYVKSDFSFENTIKPDTGTNVPAPTASAPSTGGFVDWAKSFAKPITDTVYNVLETPARLGRENDVTSPDFKPSTDLFSNTLKEIGSLEHLPFGLGEIFKQARTDPTTFASIAPSDVVNGVIGTGKDFAKFPVSAATTIGGAFIGPALDVLKNQPLGSNGALKFNIPGLGEVSNLQAQAADRVKAGENAYVVAATMTPDAIFDTLFVLGAGEKLFGARPVTIKSSADVSELTKEGGTITSPGARSFREYREPQTSTVLPPGAIEKIAAEKGIDLGPKYDPNLPSYFRIRGQANGTLLGEVVQVKPSYFRTFMDSLKSDVSKVPETEVNQIYAQETSLKAIAEAKPTEGSITPAEPVSAATPAVPEIPAAAPAGIVESLKALEKAPEAQIENQDGQKVVTVAANQKEPPVPEGATRYTVTVDGKPMIADYNPSYNGITSHIEFRSSEPNSVSDTGYKSQFLSGTGKDLGITPENAQAKIQELADSLSAEGSQKKTASKKPVESEYYTNTYGKDGMEFKQVKGKAVDIGHGLDAFISKNDTGKGWVVSEAKTGSKISNGTTQKAAIEKAKTTLDDVASKGTSISDHIESVAKARGLSPRYEKMGKQTVKVSEDESFEMAAQEESEKLPAYDAAGENASVGVFKDGTPIKVGSLKDIKPIEVPELVRLVRNLTGKIPGIKEKMGAKLGYFTGKEGEVFINANLFKQGNETQVAKTLAHEIGHLVDWLPDETLKRGNLLGHLLALKKFTSSVFSTSEGAAVDVQKIRDAATKDVLKERGLSLTDYIKDKTVREKVKNDIEAKVAELKKADGNIENDKIKEELTKVTEYWRPYDKTASSPAYLAYRKKAAEIYADAVSMLFNSPGLLEQMAPTFYKEFFKALDARPEVKVAYFSLQELLNGSSEEIFKARMDDIRKGFERAEALQEQFRAKQTLSIKSLWEKLRQQVDDVNFPITKRQLEAEKAGKLYGEGENPKFLLDEKSLVDNENFLFVSDVQKNITEPIEAAGMSQEDLGTYLLLDRMRKGRADIANPYGFNPKNANEQLDYLKSQVGADNFKLLEDKALEFHDLVFKSVEEAVRVGSYNLDTYLSEILPNRDNYAAFQVVDYMQDRMPATIKGQIGTFKEVANPLISTILKTVSLNRLNAFQRAKNATIKMLNDSFPDEISETRKITTDGKLAVFRPAEGKGGLEVLENGRMTSYDVDPYIAESFSHNKVGDLNVVVSLIDKFNNKLWKPIVTSYNLGFVLGTNPIRDFKRNYKIIPNATIGNMLKAYAESLPSAARYAKGQLDDFTRSLVESKAIAAPVNDINLQDVDSEFKSILERFGIIKKMPEKSLKAMLIKPVQQLLAGIQFTANMTEAVSKIAGAKIRIAGGESGESLAYNVRNFTGTPNWRTKGTQTKTTNAIFTFSNIIKEGYKTDLQIATNPNTRSGYWFKTVKLDLVPKFFMFLASAGVLGKELKDIMDKQTEYDKSNYIIIPIGVNPEDGKPIVIRMPHDESGRLAASFFWKMANFIKNGRLENLQDVFALGAGQFPSASPLIQLAAGWTQYLSGKNPYDNFRGRAVIDDTTWQAGGGAALTKMVEWTTNTLGLTNFSTYDASKQSGFETFMQLAPWFRSMFKITDYGLQEKYKAPLDDAKTQEARTLIKDQGIVNGYANDAIKENLTPDEALAKYGKQVVSDALGDKYTVDQAKSILDKFKNAVQKKNIDDPRISVLQSATSNNQKAEVLRAIQADIKDPADFKAFLLQAVQDKTVTEDVIRKAFPDGIQNVISKTESPSLLASALGVKTAEASTKLFIDDQKPAPAPVAKPQTIISSNFGSDKYDIKDYAEDPGHEKKVTRILKDMPEFVGPEDIDAYINKKFPKSPLTGAVILNAADKYKVDPHVIVAIAQQDSGLGTTGLGAETKNPGNYATYGKRKTRFATWQAGTNAIAQWLSTKRVSTN